MYCYLNEITMKYIFLFILLIHGLIHLVGFAKAFQLATIENIVSPISKPAGAVWLMVTLLFLITCAGFFMDKSFWPVAAIVASLLSQLIIIMVWKDAPWGTLANVIILVVAVPAYANFQFQKMVDKEIDALLNNVASQPFVATQRESENLPEPVQQWLRKSVVADKEPVHSARIKQTGRMRTAPDSKWMNFKATQYYDFNIPAFVWTTHVEMIPMINMVGRDKFTTGEGEMLIKFLSLIPVVNEANNEKINSGTMLRYLGELIWFPSTVLSPYITWEEIDSRTAKATMQYKNTTAQGIFFFTEHGDIAAFEAQRYYGGGAEAKLETWRVEVMDYKLFDDVRVPYKNRVIWKLDEGDFNWLELEITALETNNPTRFEKQNF